MKIDKLYTELLSAYSNENLNKITGKLISLYKNKNYDKIREIANRISEYVSIEEEKDAKCFAKLIILYHPDKGELIKKSIKSLYSKNDSKNLSKYSHILLLNDIEDIKEIVVDKTIFDKPEYFWDIDQHDGYSFVDFDDVNQEENFEIFDYEKSFYNAIKIREYGHLNIEFPTYYLEDFEEFELANRGIELLDGVEFCKHVVILDISNNEISDISKLWDLVKLEELFLASNQIGYIDTLSALLNLRVLDLSDNEIDDISPLFELNKLEYVNLIGNPIPLSQIDKLKMKGVIVAY